MPTGIIEHETRTNILLSTSPQVSPYLEEQKNLFFVFFKKEKTIRNKNIFF